jgi:hypothetical protein
VLSTTRGLTARVFDPQLGADAPVTGYKAAVVPTTVPPPIAGHAVAYLVGGGDARTLTSASGSLEVTFRRFDTTVTIHALEYVVTGGLASVVRAGKADVRVKNGEASAPTIEMTDVTLKKTVTFEASLPAGYSMASLEVEVDAGLRTSAIVAARPSLGTPFEVSVVPGIAYSVRGRATAVSGVSYSGRLVFDPGAEKIALVFPPPVLAESPIDDALAPPSGGAGGLATASLDPGGVLAARFDAGVVEHVLSPAAGDGTIVRVATDTRETTLPDTTRVGLSRPNGRYSWTLQHFPTLAHPELLSGPDAHVGPPSWTSAPRGVVLR